MNKIVLLTLVLSSLLLGESEIETCKKCHPLIVDEFENSMHRKSSIYDDEIHKAVWDMHPAKAKDNYVCADCHTPNAKNEQEAKKGITCSSCHTIKDIEKHASVNKNIYNKDAKTFYSAEAGRESEKVIYKKESSWFGLNKTTVGSPYHDIDYTNKNYYTGEVCMGCHSHRQNKDEFMICKASKEGAQNEQENCITCHMPKVDGTATTIRETKQHSYHGFPGARKDPQMLSKYVELDFKKSSDGFEITINNKAPHDLMLHPLRVVELRVNLVKDKKVTPLKSNSFVKVIGNKEGPSMPWLANRVIVDTMLKANEKREISYSDKVESKDKVEVQLGYYIVNPKALKKLNLEKNKDAKSFTVLKQERFIVE